MNGFGSSRKGAEAQREHEDLLNKNKGMEKEFRNKGHREEGTFLLSEQVQFRGRYAERDY